MNMFLYIITGGFLKGYRSYILGALLIVQAVASWMVGDLGLVGLIDQLPEILAGMGILTAKAASA